MHSTTRKPKRERVARLTQRYPKERVAAARAIKDEHYAEIVALASTLPQIVTLPDKRVLKAIDQTSGGLGYACADGMRVIASYDPSAHGTLLHVSVSYAKRDPRWYDLKQLRQAFFPPDVDVIQVLPRAGEYVNIHSHTFHLFQAPESWRGGWNV